MKALCIYIALTCVSINVVGNAMANTAKGLQAAQEARMEKLCAIQSDYCS
jgi:hypothetical protein